jgi:hypothetical protein
MGSDQSKPQEGPAISISPELRSYIEKEYKKCKISAVDDVFRWNFDPAYKLGKCEQPYTAFKELIRKAEEKKAETE